MIAYHLFDERGVFGDTIDVDEMEPLPLSGTAIPPPDTAAGEFALWLGGSWAVVSEVPIPPGPSLESLRAAKFAALAERRWQAETGGVDFNGSIIRSDATSQAKITGAVSLFASDPTLTVIDWEAQPGVWVEIDSATMTAIGIAVGRHVQACFSHARTLGEAINAAADQAALGAIDIEAGWPA